MVNKISDLIAKRKGSSYKEGDMLVKRVYSKRHCGRCSEIKHNSHTYKVEIEDVDDSDKYKE